MDQYNCTQQQTTCGLPQPQYQNSISPQMLPMVPGFTPMMPQAPLPVIPGYTAVVIPGGSTFPPMQAPPNFQFLPMVPLQDHNSVPMMPSASPMPLIMQPYFSEPPTGFLNVQQPCFASVSRSASPLSLYADSNSSDSVEGIERDRNLSLHSDSNCSNEEVSKADLVANAVKCFENDFGNRFDTDGLRGVNILRIKVKTRVALEHIVDFVRKCQQENLIDLISTPISTKKGRQHVRGFLAYIQAKDEKNADRLCEVFHEYNATHNNPFKAYQRNPKSTLFKKSA